MKCLGKAPDATRRGGTVW